MLTLIRQIMILRSMAMKKLSIAYSILSIILLAPVSATTTAESEGGTSLRFSSGIVPGPVPIPTSVIYTLSAHPGDGLVGLGIKTPSMPFIDQSPILGPDTHGTIGFGEAVSAVTPAVGGFFFLTSAKATVIPGQAERLPVKFTTEVSDPLVLNSDLGNLTIDVFSE